MFKKIILLFFVFLFSACSNTTENKNSELIYKDSMELQYAEQFSVDYYEGGYVMISVSNDRKYIVVPEGKQQPQHLDKNIIVLKRPMKNIYIAATAVMDMFRELDALDSIRFSSQNKWYIKEAQQEMEKGNILYAGKYNMPDYELILSQNCSLAVENNMISHSPEVAEKLEDFGIPVFIDLSSYENHPLGRVEWIKLYGILLDKEQQANIAFEKQTAFINTISEKQIPEKTVAFFFIDANGIVHLKTDYISKVIELVGGKYIFDLKEENNRSSITMQMEEFYAMAKDADYLIYDSTIDSEMTSIQQLLQKEKLLKDFKAVQQGNVWCTTQDFYQQSMAVGQMTEDIYNILENTENEILYFYRLSL